MDSLCRGRESGEEFADRHCCNWNWISDTKCLFWSTGRPSPSVIWFHGSKLIDESYTIGPHGLVRNELNLRRLNRTDFMSILTCRASNTNLTEPVVASVILDMNRKSFTSSPPIPIFVDCPDPLIKPSNAWLSLGLIGGHTHHTQTITGSHCSPAPAH